MVGPPPPIDTSVANASDPSTSPSTAGGIPKRARPAPAKTFQCRGYGECRMVFSRSEHLARHIRKHTGERPFSCHCSKQFSRLDNLRQHAHTVHADKQELNERMMRELTTLHTAHKLAGSNKGGRNRNKPQGQLHVGGQESDPTGSLLSASNAIKQEDGTGLSPSSLRPGTSTGYEGSEYYPHPSYPSHSFRDSQHSQSFLASPATSLPGPGSPQSSYIASSRHHGGGEGNHSFLAYPHHPSNPPPVPVSAPASHHYPPPSQQQPLQRIPEHDRREFPDRSRDHSFLERDIPSSTRYFPEQRSNGIDQRTLPPLSSIVPAYPPPAAGPTAGRPSTANNDNAYRPGTAPASYHSQHMVPNTHYTTNGYEYEYAQYPVQSTYGYNSGIPSHSGESPFSFHPPPSVSTRTGSSPVGVGHHAAANGAESSPFSYGPGLVATNDERPASRRLSLMDICDEPGGRPNTAGGVIGASRPNTASLANVSEGSREFARFAAAAVREQRSPGRLRDGSLSASTGSPDIDGDGGRGGQEAKDGSDPGRSLFSVRRSSPAEPAVTHFSRSAPLSPVGIADQASERGFTPTPSPATAGATFSSPLQSPASAMEVTERGSDGDVRSFTIVSPASTSPVSAQFHRQSPTFTRSPTAQQLSVQRRADASAANAINATPSRSAATPSASAATSTLSPIPPPATIHISSSPDHSRTASSGGISAHGRGGVLSPPPAGVTSPNPTSDGDVLLAVGGRSRYTSVQSAVH